ncbi:DUF6232 family protein [Streptomyces sp. NPDC059072]|uniref:DUF6232 family protein n=1 Tax=Streptomyces sp. NPDC059072 TaxID=3346715 RepID=UPI0036CDD89D
MSTPVPPPPPSSPPQAPPAPPLPPKQLGSGVELRVSRRLLWIDDAAYPLHNIARVYTFDLHPDRWKAFVQFLKGVGFTAVGLVLLLLVDNDTRVFSGSGYDRHDGTSGLVTFAVVVVIVLVIVLLTKVFAAPQHVLSVETSGPPTALVTLPDRERLRQLVGQIVHAIENPTAEFAVQVQRVGDTVNIYGGVGHTGVKK